jgi:hypothetical protein
MDVPTFFRHPLVLVLGREGGNWEREERQVMKEDKSLMAVAVVVRHSQTESAWEICSRAIRSQEIESRGACAAIHRLAPIPHQ